MRTPKKKKERAPYGTLEVQRPVRMSRELDALTKAAAKQEGLTIQEWWRRAAEAQLGRKAPAKKKA